MSDIFITPHHTTIGTPFFPKKNSIETTLSTQSSPVASGVLRRRVMVLAPGMPIDYSSSNHFSSDDSSRDSSLSSSSETSLDSSEDALYDSALGRSYFRPSHDSSSACPSHKRSRSPVAFVPLSSPTLGALSYARTDLLPSPKRIRSFESETDLEGCLEDSFEPYVPREAGLGVDFKDEKIDECIAYADALRDRGIDARVVVEAVDREEIETDVRGPVKVRVDRVTHPVVADDIPEPAQEGAVEVTYETLGNLVQRFHDHTEEIPVHRVQAIESVQRDQRHRIVATGQQSVDMLERTRELE
ncbi:hypothetical protein Tco_0355192 [Tanacetum coccineum]